MSAEPPEKYHPRGKTRCDKQKGHLMNSPKKLSDYFSDYDFEKIKTVPKNSIFRLIFSRTCISVALIILQFLILAVLTFSWSEQHTEAILLIMIVLSACIFLIILNSESNPSYKIAWIIPVALLPVFGSLLYLLFHFNLGSIASTQSVRQTLKETEKYTHTDPQTAGSLAVLSRRTAILSGYIEKAGGYATYRNTSVRYFPLGDDAFPEMIRYLEKAQHFIFLEFFIIQEGIFWNTILEILKRKVKEGVEVRVMYDDIGCMTKLPRNYAAYLTALGIKAKVFARVTPFFSTHYNNRDHRKILVIDGKAAFSGGINLADEYINREQRFGRWKDNCFLVEGSAVKNYTLMFLQMWNTSVSPEMRVYEPYLNVRIERLPQPGDGFVIPYGDGPHQPISVAQSVYLHIIQSAVDHVHIMTPYLILDDEMLNALKRAARSGVDVRLLLPFIPDKKTINLIGKSYYPELLEAGVRIYEYTPGFVHSKVVEADGIIAAVGTINLDFRSLYLHYECASLIFTNDVLKDISADFESTFADSHRITLSDYKKKPLLFRLAGRVLRVFAPLV